jgi:GT2 family glycosyltransferase
MSSVYIILLNWNGWKDTVQCLESVMRCDYKDFRVIVCDNDSSDHSMEHIKKWADGNLDAGAMGTSVHEELEPLILPAVPKPVAYVELDRETAETGALDKIDKIQDTPLVLIQTGANHGFSAGNNVGIHFALRFKPDYIWLLNNDTLIKENTLSTLVTYMETNKDTGLAGGAIYRADEPGSLQTLGGGTLLPLIGTDRFKLKAGPIDYVTGTSLFVRTQVTEEIGLLDEGFFFYWEDTDYSARAGKAGWHLAMVEDAVVYHKFSASVGSRSLKSDLFKIASLTRYFKKHQPYRWWIPVGINLLGMLIKRLFRGQFRRMVPIIKAMFKARRAYRP